MKTKFLIISFLIFTLLGAFALRANAQDSTLIADETTLTRQKTGAKITTYSEDIFQKISLKWGDQFKRLIITYKTDKKYGKYKEYAIYTSHELANNIKQWAKKNL